MLIYFDAIALYNQARPLYELLDAEWMPDALRRVYRKKYDGNPEQVRDAYKKYEADIEIDWNKVIKSLDDLGLKYDEKDIRQFRSMAEATIEESEFRKKVRDRVDRRCKVCEKEIIRRNAGETPKPFYVDTPRKLLAWYQERLQKAKK
jgi:hypothetical protein